MGHASVRNQDAPSRNASLWRCGSIHRVSFVQSNRFRFECNSKTKEILETCQYRLAVSRWGILLRLGHFGTVKSLYDIRVIVVGLLRSVKLLYALSTTHTHLVRHRLRWPSTPFGVSPNRLNQPSCLSWERSDPLRFYRAPNSDVILCGRLRTGSERRSLYGNSLPIPDDHSPTAQVGEYKGRARGKQS